MPGLSIMSGGDITVALDIKISSSLKEEGIARELINRIQNIRKEKNLDVVDKIKVFIKSSEEMISCINNNLNYICEEILANDIKFIKTINSGFEQINLINNVELFIKIERDEKKQKHKKIL